LAGKGVQLKVLTYESDIPVIVQQSAPKVLFEAEKLSWDGTPSAGRDIAGQR
jgi:hypothetical protein